ncbi:phage tail tube protein [Acetobacter persici]|uniref:phage tail tube protein n=1 Tax=Acetobacter persici TaxID=1076596 RepID=UPI001BA53A3D|nr:phage tail tube protein [Acetobacter persici]MBS1015199.1 phage tail protein [Acetobacter persici]
MAFTGATAGIAAGAQTNDTVLDWALEATYKTPPTGNYQQGRFTAETLSRQETTARPLEINTVKEVSQSVVTQIAASGRISGALSTGTYDDFLAGVLGADFLSATLASTASLAVTLTKSNPSWQNLPTIETGVSGGFAEFDPYGGILSISDASLPRNATVSYDKIVNGMHTIILPSGELDNVFSGSDPFSLSTSGSVNSIYLVNGNVDKTYTIRKKILGKYLMYPGSVINQVQLTFAQGQFAQVEIDVIPANEVLSDADVASSVLVAPSGVVHNTVDNFLGVSIFGVVPAGCVTSASIILARSGSKVDYGNGHADGCGADLGQFQATGSISLYFRTWDQYQAALSGTQGRVVIKSVDNTGNGYAFVFINAALRNPQLQTDSVNKTYELKLDIEGNPGTYGNTFAIFRLAPAS